MNMKKRIIINENERNVILNMHKNAVNKELMKESYEQEIGEVDMGRVTTGLLAGGVFGLAYTLLTGSGGSYDGVKKIFQSCSAKGAGKSTMDGTTLDSISDEVFSSVDGVGTNLEKLKTALSQIQTIPDLCAVKQRYAENHPGSDMFNDLDGDIDSDSEWNQYVYRPLLTAVRKTFELSKQIQQANATQRQSTINSLYCGVKDGVITSGKMKGTDWADYVSTYKVTNDELKVAKNSCTNIKSETDSTTTKVSSTVRTGGAGSSTRIKKIQKQIGVAETGTMDQATIDALMTKL